jgi:hypothetical protein
VTCTHAQHLASSAGSQASPAGGCRAKL